MYLLDYGKSRKSVFNLWGLSETRALGLLTFCTLPIPSCILYAIKSGLKSLVAVSSGVARCFHQFLYVFLFVSDGH